MIRPTANPQHPVSWNRRNIFGLATAIILAAVAVIFGFQKRPHFDLSNVGLEDEPALLLTPAGFEPQPAVPAVASFTGSAEWDRTLDVAANNYTFAGIDGYWMGGDEPDSLYNGTHRSNGGSTASNGGSLGHSSGSTLYAMAGTGGGKIGSAPVAAVGNNASVPDATPTGPLLAFSALVLAVLKRRGRRLRGTPGI